MRALSDALPTGHRAMANPTLQLHFGCGRATPPVSHSHNWPSGRMQNFLFKIGQKKLFFANKDPKTNFDDWMILQKHVLSFKCNDFFKMANLKAMSSSATLRHHVDGLVQGRRDSIANALELRLSCTNPWMFILRWLSGSVHTWMVSFNVIMSHSTSVCSLYIDGPYQPSASPNLVIYLHPGWSGFYIKTPTNRWKYRK